MSKDKFCFFKKLKQALIRNNLGTISYTNCIVLYPPESYHVLFCPQISFCRHFAWAPVLILYSFLAQVRFRLPALLPRPPSALEGQAEEGEVRGAQRGAGSNLE